MKTSTRKTVTPGLAIKIAGTAALALTVLWGLRSAVSAEVAPVIAAPVVDLPAGTTRSATAVLAGGCFWGVQGVFQHVRGVTNVVSGYAGGKAVTAHYEQVGSGSTGHAEAVRISYDPTQVSYGKLLQIFFSVAHDPTELNRQGPDSGTQYRSAIFAQDTQQHQVAQAYIAQLDAARIFKKRIATRIEDGQDFYPAESYHQNYLEHNPNNPYIVINDLPKVASLKRAAPQLYRADAVLAH
ncbi:MAG: peptide-methionine (S)-S-oxide reductase MsrA [Pseudomonadota bacterium]